MSDQDITVAQLSEMLGVRAVDIIKILLGRGIFATVRTSLSPESVADIRLQFPGYGPKVYAGVTESGGVMTNKDLKGRIREVRHKYILAMKSIADNPSEIPPERLDDVDDLLSLIEAEEEDVRRGLDRGPRG